MGNLEQRVNRCLQRFPVLKAGVKRAYQLAVYTLSPKLKSQGALTRVVPEDGYEYFFGYYDKCPWDATGRYLLCHRVQNTCRKADHADPAELILIDTQEGNRITVLGTSRAWNVQQGCMLQWLGPEHTSQVVYNDFRDGQYCSVICDIREKKERVLPLPVYAVAQDGSFALSLDFSRLHRLRPGYGYCNLEETTKRERCPDSPCIWRLDLTQGTVVPLLTYRELAAFAPREEMTGAEHKVNHIMLSPDGKRFMVLHRWLVGARKYTRLVTANCDGTGLYNLLDDGFVSHCWWKNNSEILTFAEHAGDGRGYFLLTDRTKALRRLWPGLVGDGHPSYSAQGRVVTDTYPDRRRVQTLYVLEEDGAVRTVARVFSPFRYDNAVRCDLHPRWSRDGRQVCIDSTFEGKRAVYLVEV